MTSMLNTTLHLQHTTPLPSSVSTANTIALLHGQEFLIKNDPHMISYKALPASNPAPEIAPERTTLTGEPLKAIATPVSYSVTDRVHALPAGLWDSDVVSTYEFINVERGVFVRIRSPMSVVMETLWTIRDREEGEEGGSGSELVEDIVIKCSRLLIGTVKGQCESGWRGIHENMVKHLQEQSKSAA